MFVVGSGANHMISINGFTVPVCDAASCVGRCGDYTSRLCQCDDSCMKLGDCCVDYQSQCKHTLVQPDLTKDYLERKAQMEVMEYEYKINNWTFLSGQTVVRCPADYPFNRELCENKTYTNLSFHHLTTVYSPHNRLLYKNKYCAQCHAVAGKLKYMPMAMECEDALIQSYQHEGKLPTVEWYECGACPDLSVLPRSISSRLLNFAPLSKMQVKNYCVLNNSADGDISKVYQYNKIEEEIYDIALSYHSPIMRMEDQYKEFCTRCVLKNWHAVLLQHMDRIQLSCDFNCTDSSLNDRGMIYKKEEKVILELLDDGSELLAMENIRICPNGAYFDLISNSCVHSPCSVGSILVQGECYSFTETISGFRMTREELVVFVVQSGPYDYAVGSVRKIQEIFVGFGELTVRWEFSVCPDLFQGKFCLRLHIGHHSPNRLLTYLTFKPHLQRFLDAIDQAFRGVTHVAVFNYQVTEDQSCKDGEFMYLPNATLLVDAFRSEEFLKSDVVTVFDEERGIRFPLSASAVGIWWQFGEPSQLTGGSLAVCISNTNLYTCKRQIFPPNSYVVIKNGRNERTLKIAEMNLTVSLSSGDFLITRQGSLMICPAHLKSSATGIRYNYPPFSIKLLIYTIILIFRIIRL